MDIKQYQEKAIKELLNESKDCLEKDKHRLIIFKSPTGSGKTIMLAEFLKQICNQKDFNDSLSFIWTAPRALHEQSKKKLSDYYKETRNLDCLEFQELSNRKIDSNEILFFNWESINKKNNIYIRENERENNLSKVIERTKMSGNKIILIIDESHHGAPSPKSQELIKDMKPDLTINVSATPVVNNPDKMISVDIVDVKFEGMIKKSAKLNEGFRNEQKGNNIYSDLEKSSSEIVLERALEKRKKLLDLYRKIGTNINPLLLIQIPDRRSKKDDELKERILNLLDKNHNISVENGNLGIWLSEQKQGLEDIEKLNSPIDVLIFKQAIAMGWDCPRSHILALFREWSGINFSIQTLGRIMRVADPIQGHYPLEYEDLNHAYVLSNLSNIILADDISLSYTTIYTSERKSIYSSLQIPSWHRVRQREKTRLSPLFLKIFKQKAEEQKLHEKINKTDQTVKKELLSPYILKNIDELKHTSIDGDIVHVENEKDLEIIFNDFISESLKQEPYFHPEERSVNALKESIYIFFHNFLKIERDENYKKIVKTTLSSNIDHFLKVIEVSKKAYIDEVNQNPQELDKTIWDVPLSANYNQEYEKYEVKKSIMSPFYIEKRASKPEKDFIKWLDENEKVKWWFKNGTRDATFFSIPYKKDNRDFLFYVDFIVQLTDGRIGLFDTKGQSTAKESEEKVKGLEKYLDQNQNIFGGIVLFKNYWKIYKENGQDFDIDKDDNWEVLDFN